MCSTSSAERAPAKATRSLATRLTQWYTLSAFALIAAVTGYLYWSMVAQLQREDEEFLKDYVYILRSLLREHPDDASALKQEVEWEMGARRHARVFVRIIGAEGSVLAETPGIPACLGRDAFPSPAPVAEDPKASRKVSQASGTVYRAMAAEAAVGPHLEAIHVVQVALDTSEVEVMLASFRGQVLPLLAVSLLVCALVGNKLARRGMLPVEEISRAASRIRTTTLNERIDTAGLPAEIHRLAGRFNEMLERLEEAFARISQFSSDIAHELRTPLNNMRGEVEVALGKPRSAEEYHEVLGSCLEEAHRLSRMIDSLLFLARAERPETQVRREPVNVSQELEAVREFYEAAASEAGVCLEVKPMGKVSAFLDRALFQRAIGNLVENALAYTPSGGVVTLAATRNNGRLRVDVEDTGCGIPPEALPHVFDRLFRVDKSRSAATGGVGLGLAIVRRIAELHGGTAMAMSDVGRGTRVTLELPDHSGQAPPAPPLVTKK